MQRRLIKNCRESKKTARVQEQIAWKSYRSMKWKKKFETFHFFVSAKRFQTSKINMQAINNDDILSSKNIHINQANTTTTTRRIDIFTRFLCCHPMLVSMLIGARLQNGKAIKNYCIIKVCMAGHAMALRYAMRLDKKIQHTLILSSKTYFNFYKKKKRILVGKIPLHCRVAYKSWLCRRENFLSTLQILQNQTKSRQTFRRYSFFLVKRTNKSCEWVKKMKKKIRAFNYKGLKSHVIYKVLWRCEWVSWNEKGLWMKLTRQKPSVTFFVKHFN